MSPLPDKPLKTAPITAGLVTIRAPITAGQCTIVTRHHNQRIIRQTTAIQRIHHLPHHPVKQRDHIPPGTCLTRTAQKLRHTRDRTRFMRRRSRQIKKKGRIFILRPLLNIRHSFFRKSRIRFLVVPVRNHQTAPTTRHLNRLLHTRNTHRLILIDKTIRRLRRRATRCTVKPVKPKLNGSTRNRL